jgi:hypothetical protein
MSAANPETAKRLRIGAQQAKDRLESGRPILVLDVRSPKAWNDSRVKIEGAIRVSPGQFTADPSWPKDRFTLAYCT